MRTKSITLYNIYYSILLFICLLCFYPYKFANAGALVSLCLCTGLCVCVRVCVEVVGSRLHLFAVPRAGWCGAEPREQRTHVNLRARTSSKANSSTSSSSKTSSSPTSGHVTAARADASLLRSEKPLQNAWRYPEKKGNGRNPAMNQAASINIVRYPIREIKHGNLSFNC